MIISSPFIDMEHIKAALPAPVRRSLGVSRRRLRALPFRTRRQKERLLMFGGLTAAERELLTPVESKIFHEDGMYTGDGAHYFKVGLSAIHCIDAALGNAGVESVDNILDLPCGYGRVMRFLVARFPGVAITACELVPEAVRFCVDTFGAIGARSSQNFQQLSFNRPFDLIWCGSLATHLDGDDILALLQLFQRSLSPGGLVVFTTHGERVIDRMLSGDYDYAIAKERILAIIDSCRATGFGFTNYPDVTPDGVTAGAGYGVSLTAPDWVRTQAARVGGLREVFFEPHSWDNHQDVFGFVSDQ